MIVVPAPLPTIEVLLPRISRSPMALLPLNPSAAPGIVRLYVPAGTLIVVPGLRFAKVTAPRRLQSFAAAVQADAAALSSVRSTVMPANGTGAAIIRASGANSPRTRAFCFSGSMRAAELSEAPQTAAITVTAASARAGVNAKARRRLPWWFVEDCERDIWRLLVLSRREAA